MDINNLLLATLPAAFGGTLMMFIVSAVAVQGTRNAKLSWRETLLFFFISLAIVFVIYVVILFINPSFLGNEFSGVGLFVDWVIPLLASVGTLLVLWNPKATKF